MVSFSHATQYFVHSVNQFFVAFFNCDTDFNIFRRSLETFAFSEGQHSQFGVSEFSCACSRDVSYDKVSFAGFQSNDHTRNVVDSGQFFNFGNLVNLVVPDGVDLGSCNSTFQISNRFSVSLRSAFFNESNYVSIVVRQSEVNGFFTFSSDGHTSDSSIDFAGYYCRRKTIPFNFVYFEFSAHGISQFFSDHYVIAISEFFGASDLYSAAFSRSLGPVVRSVSTFHTNFQNFLVSFFFAATATSGHSESCYHSTTSSKFQHFFQIHK